MGTFDSEIKYWKNYTASFNAKRAALRPLSFEYLSGAYRSAGNLNGAVNFDSSNPSNYQRERDRLLKELRGIGDAYSSLGGELRAHPLTPTPKKTKGTGTSSITRAPAHSSVLAPSQNVLQLEQQNETLGDKIKDVGGTFFRGLFGGLAYVSDKLSRFGYAVRTSAEGYAEEYKKPDSAGGTHITGTELIKTFINPVVDVSPIGIAANKLMGDKKANPDTYHDMWTGLTGKTPTGGSDLLKTLFPEWTSDHKKWTTAIGFGVDVGYDPLTFITVGDSAVVTGTTKAVAAGGLKVVGRKALADTMLASTIYTKTGRAAGRQALEDYLRLKPTNTKPIKEILTGDFSRTPFKAEKKTGKKSARVQKKAAKVAHDPDKLAEIAPKLAKAKAAHTAARKTLEEAQEKALTESFTGMQLARKAVFNKTLGLGSWDAFTKGVRGGGLNSPTAKAYASTSKALKDKDIEDMTTGHLADDFRKIHNDLKDKGINVVWGGRTKTKVWAIPDDYDDFVREYVDITHPFVPLRELTKVAANRRFAILNAKEAEAQQFFRAFMNKVKDNYGDLPEQPRGRTPGGGGGGGGQPAAPHNAPPTPTPVPRIDVGISNEADDVIEKIVEAKKLKGQLDQQAWDDMTDAERIYATEHGYTPSLLSYRLFAEHLINNTDPENMEIVNEFTNRLDELSIEAGAAGKLRLPGTKGRVGNITISHSDEGLPELLPMMGKPDPEKRNYERARNTEIAKIVDQAWEESIAKLAASTMANDPDSVVNAMQGAVAHLINQMTADTHMQVAQYLANKHGMSFLPMAPNAKAPRQAIVHFGGLRGPVRHAGGSDFEGNEILSDLSPFIDKGVKTDPNRPEPNLKGQPLYNNIQDQLVDDLGKATEVLNQTANFPNGTETTHAKYHTEPGIINSVGQTPFDMSFVGRSARDSLYITNEQGERIGAYRGIPGIEGGTLQDLMEDIWIKGSAMNDNIHLSTDPSISNYSLLDHWIYGENAAKEMKITTEGGKTSIGRLAHYDEFSPEDLRTIYGIREAIPKMDEELLKRLQIVKRLLGNKRVPPEDRFEIADFMNKMLSWDMIRIHQSPWGEMFDKPDPYHAMETLGWHLNLVANTAGNKLSVGVRTALAKEIWSTPLLFKELNQSIMLGTLHRVYVKRMGYEQAATDLANLISRYPLAARLMGEANAKGVTNGSNGMRTIINTVGDTDIPMPVAPPASLPPGDQAAITDAANIHTPASPSQTNPGATPSVKPSPETKAQGAADADNSSNPPGGFSADPSPLAESDITGLINEIKANTDLNGIQDRIADVESALFADMVDYSNKMNEEFKNVEIRTGKMVRIAGMPVMPLPTIMPPIHSYAGIVSLKERQGRVANWVDDRVWPKSSESRVKASLGYRRPSKTLNGVLNDIRRSVANNAQERLIATHAMIRQTYLQFKNKAERQADTLLYFSHGVPLPEKFNEVQMRLDDITNHILQHEDGSYRSVKNMRLTALSFNRVLPRKYKLPDAVFDEDFIEGAPPFSREWFYKVSRHLSKNEKNDTHVLSISNIANRLHMGNYEFALQHALSKMELSRELHMSMFDNFTFDMTDEMAEVANASLHHDDQYVRLGDHYNDELMKYINAEYAERWVHRGMLKNMAKMTQFIENQHNYKYGDFNFGIMTKINNYWKSIVTNYNIPKYHIGNVMSDGFVNMMDGVRINAYRKASIVMVHSHALSRRISKDPEGYAAFMRPDMTMDPGNIDRELKEISDPLRARSVTQINILGKPTTMNSEMIIKLYHDYGLGQTQVNGNLLRSSAVGNNKASQFYTWATDKILDLSNAREDFFRLAHFIHALESESKIARRSLDEIAIAARDRVIKFHFDYGDVSEFERVSVGRYLPFYKWQRNILPLAMSQLFTNPRIYTIPNYANQAMGEALFPTQEDANGNEIPISYITPDFVADSNMVPIGKYTDPNGNEQARYAVLNLPLDQALVTWLMPFVSPIADPNVHGIQKGNEAFKNTTSTLLSKANPFIVAIAQAGLGTTAVTGDSFKSGDYDWLRTLSNVAFPNAGVAIENIQTRNEGGAQKTLGDFLGIIRERKSSEGIQRGQLHEQNDKMTAVYKKAARIWMAQNYPGIDSESEEGKKILHDYFVSTGTLQR